MTAKNSNNISQFLFLFIIFTSIGIANPITNLISEKQQSLINDTKANTFERNADINYLTTPFDKEIYYHRNTMSENGQKVYDLMMEDLLKFGTQETNLRYKLVQSQGKDRILWDLNKLGIDIGVNEEKNLKNLNEILGYDESRLFHVYYGSYTPYQDILFTKKNGKITEISIAITPTYAQNPKKYQEDLLAIEEGMQRIWVGITDDMTDAQKLKIAHTNLGKSLKYTIEGRPENFNLTTLALANSIAICGGYAEAMRYIAHRLGLQSLYMPGYRMNDKGQYTGGHVWNWVKVDNQWYQIDGIPSWGKFLVGVDNPHQYKILNSLDSYWESASSPNKNYKFNYPVLARYNYGEHSKVGGIINSDIRGLSQTSFDETAMAQYDKWIKEGYIKEASKPTGLTIRNSIINIGAKTEIRANVIGSRVDDMHISGSIIKLGDDIKIDKNLHGAVATTTGNIEDVVILIGNNNEINRAFDEANGIYDTRGAMSNSGNITNVYVRAESNNIISGNVTIAQIQKGDANISNVIVDFDNNNILKKDFIGAKNDSNGSINNTTITFKDNANIKNLIGAEASYGNISNTEIIFGNNAIINGDLIGAKIANVGNINNTTIILSGKADVKGDIIGGRVGTGEVTGSNIYIYDTINTTNSNRIIGGQISAADVNSKAINNLIYIDTDANMPNTKLFGGFSDNGDGDILTGNRLYFSGRKGVFSDIANFETIEIHVGKISNQSSPTQNQIIANDIIATSIFATDINEPIITLTDTTSTTDLSKTTISLSLNANSNIDNINILKKDGGSITAPKNSIVKALKGISSIEEFELKMDGNNTLMAANKFLNAVAQEKTQNISTATMSEFAVLSSGNDIVDLILLDRNMKNNINTSYIAPNNVTQNRNIKQNSKTNTANVIARAGTQSNALKTFGMIRGGDISHANDARVNTRVVNIIVGIEKKISNKTYYGIFFESGYGSYDSHSDTLQGRATGEGDNIYYGGGILLSSKIGRSSYTEASLRLGQINSSYSSNDLGLDSNPRLARFSTSKIYYSGHVGIGKVLVISQRTNMDLYAKAYYGHIGEDNIVLDTGDRLSFLTSNSLIGKIGARYVYNIASNYAIYGGGSYEYEMLGGIKTLNNTFNKYYNLPGIEKATYAIEAGTQIQSTSNDNVIINLHAKYLMGARSGIAGSFKGVYRF